VESLLKVIILAIIQGVTEFLPVSSSGHLVVAKGLFGLESPGVALEVALHVGTLVAIVLYYWQDLMTLATAPFRGDLAARKSAWRQLLLIAIASVPIAPAGFFLKGFIEPLFSNSRAVGGLLVATAVIVSSTAFMRRSRKSIDVPRSALVGVAQAIAILPGISRSGATIAMGNLVGIAPADAVRFSFLIAVPAFVGAICYELIFYSADFRLAYIPGAVVSAVVGYFSLKLLINAVKSNKLWMFGPYCAIVGLVAILFL